MSDPVWDVCLKGVAGDLSLDVRFSTSAQTVALVGANAAGKTSVLRFMTGTRSPAGGHFRIRDRTLFDSERGIDLPPERRSLGYVPQGYGLFPHLRALDNVAFGLRRADPDSRRMRAHELLAEVGAEHLADRFPKGLSGGEQQRVALARALAVEPAGLLLDEPLAALDTASRRRMRAFLTEYLSTHPRPTLVVTHDVRDVAALGSEVVVLDRGRIVQQGTVEALRAAPVDDFVAEFFGAP